MAYAKSARKKEYIIEKATSVFAQKGFAKVTMQDIVQACGISRGGLYLYFGSTKEVFLSVFTTEAAKSKAALETALWEKRPIEEIVTNLIKKIKAELCHEGSALALATYEFFIESNEEQLIYRWQFDDLAESLRELIVYGIEAGFFHKVDAAAWARHIAYWISGLRLTAPVLDLPEPRIDEEIILILSPLLVRGKVEDFLY